jgi:hypothetical protein
MKKKIGEIYNKPIVVGNKNEVTKNEIHKSELEGKGGEGTMFIDANSYEDRKQLYNYIANIVKTDKDKYLADRLIIVNNWVDSPNGFVAVTFSIVFSDCFSIYSEPNLSYGNSPVCILRNEDEDYQVDYAD